MLVTASVWQLPRHLLEGTTSLDVTQCILVGIHRHFGSTHCLCLKVRKIRVNTTFIENIGPDIVKLGYNVMEGTEYFVSLYTSVVLTE
jgi:hypothetical protein